MIIELFGQIVGALVLISLGVTLFFYIRFKRYQKKRNDNFSLVSEYSAALMTLFLIFGTYFNSLGQRFPFMQTVEMQYLDERAFLNLNKGVIDSRPFLLCEGIESYGNFVLCSTNPFHKTYYSVEELPKLYKLTPSYSFWVG